MKIFWSWQSDNHQPTGRYFVRDVLTDLARELNGLDAIDDADRPGDEDGDVAVVEDDRISVDHDMKGIAGHAPIAETILKKIENAAIFVADLTPIATTKAGKKVPNPNVMIELGYALKALGHQRLVLIVNQMEGVKLDQLPFDLRHWSAPVMYKLARDAGEQKIAEQAEQLKEQLRPRLKAGVKVAAAEMFEKWRSTNPQPELVVAAAGTMELPVAISQDVRQLGVETLDQIRKKVPLLKLPVAPTKPAIVPQRPFASAFDQFSTRPTSLWSREETETYNRFVEQYYDQYQGFLGDQKLFLQRLLRTFQVELVLENKGTAPATDIDVTLHFPPSVHLYDLDDGFPSGPEAPKPPPLRPMRTGEGFISAISSSIGIPRLVAPSHLRSLSIDTERNQARFHERHLKHYERVAIDPFLVSFRTAEDIANFEVSYSITVSEPIKPTEGVLQFTVAKEAPPADEGASEAVDSAK